MSRLARQLRHPQTNGVLRPNAAFGIAQLCVLLSLFQSSVYIEATVARPSSSAPDEGIVELGFLRGGVLQHMRCAERAEVGIENVCLLSHDDLRALEAVQVHGCLDDDCCAVRNPLLPGTAQRAVVRRRAETTFIDIDQKLLLNSIHAGQPLMIQYRHRNRYSTISIFCSDGPLMH